MWIAAKGPVKAAQPVAIAELIGQGHVAAISGKILTGDNRKEARACIALIGDTDLAAGRDTVKVTLQDEIHHARNTVGTINGRGSAGQNIDPFNQILRNRIDVDRCGVGNTGDMTLSVYQDKCPVSAQVSQIETVDACLTKARIRATR